MVKLLKRITLSELKEDDRALGLTKRVTWECCPLPDNVIQVVKASYHEGINNDGYHAVWWDLLVLVEEESA